MQGGAGRVNVLVVLRAGFLESVKSAVGVILGETRVRLAFLRQLYRLMLTGHDSDLLSKHPELVHVSHSCIQKKKNIIRKKWHIGPFGNGGDSKIGIIT